MNPRFLISLLSLLIGALVAWFLFQTNPDLPDSADQDSSVFRPSPTSAPDPTSNRNPNSSSARDDSVDPNAIPFERIVSFKNDEDYQKFLKSLNGTRVRNLGQLDQLRAVRLGFTDKADFDRLGLNPNDLEFNYPVFVPPLPDQPDSQDGIVGFGAGALAFLGITEDNSEWGRGVKIAVIDTGIMPHLTLDREILHINISELPEGAVPHGHATSVASLIAGDHPNLRGVAPAADLISVRVTDETGSSSSFLLAQGIIAAADAGAQLINISLGSNGNSRLVQDAVNYATAKGSLIFASSGNDGLERSAFPGRHENVYSVGAVDALGQHLTFSNSDPNLHFTAPGLSIQAAADYDGITSFSGTSASVAYPVGAVAALMSQSSPPLSAQAAVDTLLGHTNEAGTPGQDPQFGQGIVDLGRALQRNTPGIYDLAVASQSYLLPTEGTTTTGLQVSVENRGTEFIHQSTLAVTIGNENYSLNLANLAVNERRVLTIPTGLQTLLSTGELDVRSAISLGSQTPDALPQNNQRNEKILLPASGP